MPDSEQRDDFGGRQGRRHVSCHKFGTVCALDGLIKGDRKENLLFSSSESGTADALAAGGIGFSMLDYTIKR